MSCVKEKQNFSSMIVRERTGGAVKLLADAFFSSIEPNSGSVETLHPRMKSLRKAGAP